MVEGSICSHAFVLMTRLCKKSIESSIHLVLLINSCAWRPVFNNGDSSNRIMLNMVASTHCQVSCAFFLFRGIIPSTKCFSLFSRFIDHFVQFVPQNRQCSQIHLLDYLMLGSCWLSGVVAKFLDCKVKCLGFDSGHGNSFSGWSFFLVI